MSGALGFASLLASFYFMYGYSFMIGGYFIREDFINKTFDKVYTPGDILAVFFGVIFGIVGTLDAFVSLLKEDE